MSVTEPSVGATGWNTWGHGVTTIVNTVEDAPARLDALESGAVGAVTSVTAANSTITIAGTGTAPTVAVGAIAESQVTNLTTDLAAKAAKASNLSDLTSASAARTNLGLAPIAASGSATDLSTGTVPIARLGASGSASSATFLRGDNIWTTPPTGGGGGGLGVFDAKATYGAAGNGVADDTTAIQNAINAATTAGGGRVYLRAGTYVISSALTMKRRVILMGDGTAASNANTGTIIYQSSTTANAISAVDERDMGIENLSIVGPASGTGTGIRFTRSVNADIARLAFRNIQVTGFGGQGIELSNPITSVFDSVLVDSTAVGWNVHGVTGAGGSAGTSCTFLGCFTAGCTQTGYRLDNMAYCAFVGCASDACGIAYELIESGTQGISFVGCGCESMVSGGGSYPGIGWKINAAIGVTLTGCYTFDQPNISIWVTGNANAVNITGFSENTPQVGAVNSIKIDAGSIVTLSDTATDAAMALNGTVMLVNDGGGLTVPGYGFFGGPLILGGALRPAAVTLTDAATIATNAALGNLFRVTLGGNRTLGNPTGMVDGQTCTWELIQDGTGSRTLALGAAFALGTTITSTTLTTTAAKRDFLTAVYNSTAAKWYVTDFVKGF